MGAIFQLGSTITTQEVSDTALAELARLFSLTPASALST